MKVTAVTVTVTSFLGLSSLWSRSCSKVAHCETFVIRLQREDLLFKTAYKQFLVSTLAVHDKDPSLYVYKLGESTRP